MESILKLNDEPQQYPCLKKFYDEKCPSNLAQGAVALFPSENKCFIVYSPNKNTYYQIGVVIKNPDKIYWTSFNGEVVLKN